MNFPSTGGNGAASPVHALGQDRGHVGSGELILLLQGKGQMWTLAVPRGAASLFQTQGTEM